MSFGTDTKQAGNGDGGASKAARTSHGGRRLKVGSQQRQMSTQDSACLLSAILEGANDEVESVLNSTAPIVMTPGAMWTLYDVPEGTDVDGLIPELFTFESELETETLAGVGPFYVPVPDCKGTSQFFLTEAESTDLQVQQGPELHSEESTGKLQEARPWAAGPQESQTQMLERGSIRDQFLALPNFVSEARSRDSSNSEGFPTPASRDVSESFETERERGHEDFGERDGKSSSTSTTGPGVQNSVGVEKQPQSFLSTFATDISEHTYAAQMMEVMSGGHEDAQTLANRGIGANTRDNRGRTVLMKAAMGGNLEFVNSLINTSTNYDLQDKAGCTALMWAAVSGQEDIVSLLLEKQANVDVQNKYGSTALMMASMNGKLGIVNALMTCRPNINAQDKFGRTTLMKAAMNSKLEVVNMLINGGANVDVQDQAGETVLMKVAMVGNSAIASKLISCNASLDLQDENGQTAVMKAAAFGRTTIANALLTAGAAVNLQDKSGETALMHAAAEGVVQIVESLITHGADMDEQDQAGRTTLMKASIDGHLSVVNLLVSSGANVHVQDKAGRTAYHQAMMKGYRDIARVLDRAEAYKEIETGPSDAPISEGSPLSMPLPRHHPGGDDAHRGVGISETSRPPERRPPERRRSCFRSTSTMPSASSSVGRTEATGARRDLTWSFGSTGRLRKAATPEQAEAGELKIRLGPLWRLARLLKRATSFRRG